jgi:hypothetical protein
MLDYFYHIAFDATAETKNLVFADQQAVGEWDIVGKHRRVYFEMPALLKQLGIQ